MLFHFVLSKITILDRTVGKFRPPSPQIKEGKMALFAFRVPSSLFFGGRRREGGGLLFHFILSKIVVLGDRRTLYSGLLTAIVAPFF